MNSWISGDLLDETVRLIVTCHHCRCCRSSLLLRFIVVILFIHLVFLLYLTMGLLLFAKRTATASSLLASSGWFYVLISKYITGTDRLHCSRKDCFKLDASFNARYAVKYYVFALILALCRARLMTILTIHTYTHV
jgi:hypothetical protein